MNGRSDELLSKPNVGSQRHGQLLSYPAFESPIFNASVEPSQLFTDDSLSV